MKMKKEIETKYPEFDRLILEIESKYNISQLKNYPKSLKKGIRHKTVGKYDLVPYLLTRITEHFVKSKEKLTKIFLEILYFLIVVFTPLLWVI